MKKAGTDVFLGVQDVTDRDFSYFCSVASCK
jgi:hypothetical protein